MAPMNNRGPIISLAAAVVALCLCLVCAGFGVAAYVATQGTGLGPTSGEFAGYYTNGFEVSAFVPCEESGATGSGEGWWLGADPGINFYEQYSAIAASVNPPAGGYVTVFVRFRGTASPPGNYGHLGAYSREVTVHEVLEMTLDGSCAGG